MIWCMALPLGEFNSGIVLQRIKMHRPARRHALELRKFPEITGGNYNVHNVSDRGMKLGITITLICCAVSILAEARPPKGFHSGPYLQVMVGAVDSSFDTNLVNNTRASRDQELAFGFLFGWHVSDNWGAFMDARYATDLNGGVRQHMVNGNVGATYTLILDALTDFRSLRILPFIGGDVALRVDALPVDPAMGFGLADRLAVGPGVMGGVNFLFRRYVYIGILAQEDFLHFFSATQDIAGVSTTVYRSGWHPQWSASLNAGFHF